MDCFFFSTQTFTTVGYGAIAPKGIMTSAVASFEAFLGLVFFAIATGLMYTRFSKPKATLVYSKNALIAPYLEGEALMFRTANERSNVLMQMEAKLILSMHEPGVEGERKYFNLSTEIDKVLFLAMSWTLVHKIDEESPLYGITSEELVERGAEVLILLTGFDDTFNQTVHSRHSYTADEIVWKAKFKRPYRTEPNGKVIMDVSAIHDYEKV
jgi:inward rectifier potassium channel